MGTFDLASGFGMLALGLLVMMIAGLIALKVINTMEKNKQEAKERKEREKIYGSN